MTAEGETAATIAAQETDCANAFYIITALPGAVFLYIAALKSMDDGKMGEQNNRKNGFIPGRDQG